MYLGTTSGEVLVVSPARENTSPQCLISSTTEDDQPAEEVTSLAAVSILEMNTFHGLEEN